MSFGFAIGDFIAVLGLFERIATELRNFRDAPARFQNLIVELDLLRSTLAHVLQTQSDDESDKQIVERIRAIVTHCHQPLRTFLNKLQSKEGSLGHYRTARLSDVGVRMKWSMVTQKDIDELRKILLSEMVAINMLLSIQQLMLMRSMSSRMIEPRQNSAAILDQTSTMLGLVQSIPGSITDLHLTISRHGQDQTEQGLRTSQEVRLLSMQVAEISTQGERTLQIIQSGGAQIVRAMTRLSSIMRDMRNLLYLLSKCSKDMLESIQRNTRLLLDMAAHMKRIARAIESIPLHLSLDIIRLDDALGESWGLPFQACQTYDSFYDMLRVVVYANERPGLEYITQNRFELTFAKTGRQVKRHDQWPLLVKAGTHLQQSMIVSELPFVEDACPHSGCAGSLVSEVGEIDKKCSQCGRITITKKLDLPLLQIASETRHARLPPHVHSEDEANPSQASINRHTQSSKGDLASAPTPWLQHTHLFHRIQIFQTEPPVSSVDEAYEKLADDASHSQANAFLGWHALSMGWHDEAIHRLERAVAADTGGWAPFYLLARAFMEQSRLGEAYTALQETAMRHGRNPDVWNTVSVLFFQNKQYRDSLDALSRSIRLDPNTWEYWFNLAVLYHAANQRQDALDALRRALEVNPTQIEIRRQIHELEAANTDASATRLTTMIECALRHISEPTPLFTEDKTIHIKTLNLEDEEEWYTEGEGSEEVSDEFESDQDDDAHYFTSDAGDLNP